MDINYSVKILNNSYILNPDGIYTVLSSDTQSIILLEVPQNIQRIYLKSKSNMKTSNRTRIYLCYSNTSDLSIGKTFDVGINEPIGNLKKYEKNVTQFQDYKYLAFSVLTSCLDDLIVKFDYDAQGIFANDWLQQAVEEAAEKEDKR